jgi:hypothetical protein
MNDKGPMTFITDLSNKRNRWKGLAFAWRAVAVSAIRPCSECGLPSIWHVPEKDLYLCALHWEESASDIRNDAVKLPWNSALTKALQIEAEMEEDA